MNRAMFSGVAGLKSHQTKMDVIGNNIANVNTYGYKSQRAIFSDIYYQTIKSASAGTASRGGTNPSSVGYGSSLSAVQTQMTQSSMQNTGYGLDVAITGEGFLQVMDPDGNIFYTKAGLLDYDSNGYLVDINGNFVLGAGSQDGVPSNQKIRLDNVSAVDPSISTVTETINGIDYSITASNPTKYGDISISIGSSTALPAGLKATATISTTGGITVLLNENENFNSMTELNNVINQAIKEANNGMETAAGTFTITASENKFGTEAAAGTFTGSGNSIDAKLTPVNASTFFESKLAISGFLPAGATPDENVNFTTTLDTTALPAGSVYVISTNINGTAYSGRININASTGSTVTLSDSSGNSTIGLKVLDGTGLSTTLANATVGTGYAVSVQKPQYFLGGVAVTGVSNTFPNSGTMTFSMDNYTESGFDITARIGDKEYTQTVAYNGNFNLSTGDPGDGTISVSVPTKEEVLKNLGLNDATDLETALQSSIGWCNYVAIAYKPAQTIPLTGAQITGTNFGTITGTVTGMDKGLFGGGMTFVKTSTDFVGEGIVDNEDLNATYVDDGAGHPYWQVDLDVAGRVYTGTIYGSTTSTTLLLKSDDGDYLQVTNPGFEAMTEYYQSIYPGTTPINGLTVDALTGGETLTVTPSKQSREMGLSSIAFALTGGSEGGAVTLDELTSISLGADGTVSVTHPEKGTVVVGKISLATFANSAGLQLEGTNYYSATQNSGDPKLCDPGSDGSGSLKSSALEMSNVDLSSEFAEMITTQRGYQANARIITVSDTMLEELINLKR